MAKKINITAQLNAATTDGILADAGQIFDAKKGKFQEQVNEEFENALEEAITSEDTDMVVESIEEGIVHNALRKTEQILTEAEKYQARENIGAVSEQTFENEAVRVKKQVFTSEQKCQARHNISAITAEEAEKIAQDKIYETSVSSPDKLQAVKELSSWLESNPDNAATMNEKISENYADIQRLYRGTGIDEYSQFSTGIYYAAGAVVLYDGVLFRFKADHAKGAWDYNEIEEWSEKKEREEKIGELEQEVGSLEHENVSIVSLEFNSGYISNLGNVIQSDIYIHSKPFLAKKDCLYVIKCKTNYSISVFSKTDDEGSFYKPIVKAPNSMGSSQYFYYYATEDEYLAVSGLKNDNIILLEMSRMTAFYEYLSRVSKVINYMPPTEYLNRLIEELLYTKKAVYIEKKGYYIDDSGLIRGDGGFPGYAVDIYEVSSDDNLVLRGYTGGVISAAAAYSDKECLNVIKAYNTNSTNVDFKVLNKIEIPSNAVVVAVCRRLDLDLPIELCEYNHSVTQLDNNIFNLYKKIHEKEFEIEQIKSLIGNIKTDDETATEKVPLEIFDGYISNNGILITGNSSYLYTKPISVLKGELYVIKCLSNYSVAVVSKTDKDATCYSPIIQAYNSENIETFYYVADEDCYLSFSAPKKNGIEVVKVARTTGFNEWVRRLNKNTSEVPFIKNVADAVIRDLYIVSMQPKISKKGYYIEPTGAIQGDGSFPGYIIDLYEAQPLKEYILRGGTGGVIASAIACPDDTLSDILGIYGVSDKNANFNVNTVIKVPEGANIIAVCRKTSVVPSIQLYEQSLETSTLESIYNRLNIIESSIPKKGYIISWGDSLTAGAGGNGTTYSNVLQSLLNNEYEVLNAGVGGETTYTIAARQGGEPMCLGSEITIPSSLTPVAIQLTNFLGKPVLPLKQGGAAMINPCYIDGIKGYLSQSNGVYSFTRSETGDERKVNAYTPIITNYMKTKRFPYAMIIWIGTNGQYDTTEDLIKQYKKMIEYSGCDNYVVIGMHYINSSYTVDVRKEQEDAFRKEFGVHFLNWREYLATNAIKDAELTPTEQDSQAMLEGKCPPVFLTDAVHLTATAYTLLANQIYNTLSNLGAI